MFLELKKFLKELFEFGSLRFLDLDLRPVAEDNRLDCADNLRWLCPKRLRLWSTLSKAWAGLAGPRSLKTGDRGALSEL